MTKAPNEAMTGITGKIVAITGHRPGKIFSYAEAERELVQFYIWLFKQNKPKEIISGMAQGADFAAAEAATTLDIPWHAYIPCWNQECKWPFATQQAYKQLLQSATTKKFITNGPYNNSCMNARNRAMVKDCQIVLALWDGSPGGTGNAVGFARATDRPIANCLDLWQEFVGKYTT